MEAFGLKQELSPGLRWLADWARKNAPEIIVLGHRMGAYEESLRLAEASDVTAIVRSMAPARFEGAERKQTIDALAYHLKEAYEGRPVPLRPLLPEDPTSVNSLPLLVAYFESPAGRAYTAALPAMLPELMALVRSSNPAAETRAAFCRETRKLCGAPARR